MSTDQDASHLLVVDDDDRIRDLTKRLLASKGFKVSVAANVAAAEKLIESFDFDLIVLDIMMPGEDGLSFTERLRKTSQIPVLLLTARGMAEDRIKGLSLGADDYLSKPFEPEELALRIAAILRRRPKPVLQSECAFGAFKFDRARGELRREGELIRLTESQIELLRALTQVPGEPVSREELMRRTSAALERSVDVQMTRLRRIVEDDPRAPYFLQTVRGIGYRLVSD